MKNVKFFSKIYLTGIFVLSINFVVFILNLNNFEVCQNQPNLELKNLANENIRMENTENQLKFFNIKKVFFNMETDSIALLQIQDTNVNLWKNELLKNLVALQKLTINNSKIWIPLCKLNYQSKEYNCFYSKLNFNRSLDIFWNNNEINKCDIHAGYSELENCIKDDKKKFIKIHYLTILRNPQERYISEFKNVKKGATWSQAVRKCLYLEMYSKTCYDDKKDWSYVQFIDFLKCEYNLANNRQVRMLADYNRIGCDKLKCWLKSSNCSLEMKKKIDYELLESSKETLASFSFFGLQEYSNLSFKLFGKTFENKLKFRKPFPAETKRVDEGVLDSDFNKYLNEINENNQLDIQLYEFAKQLFFQRVSFYLNESIQYSLSSTTISNYQD